MAEITPHSSHDSSLKIAAHDAYQRWRLLKDKLVERGVVIGGLSIIVAIVLIFFYLLYVVFPLLLSADAKPLAQYPLPEAGQGQTLYLAMEEQNEVAVRFTDTGKAIFFNVADGKTVLLEALPVPEQTQMTSFAHGNLDTGVFAYGLSDGRALVVRQEYKVSYPEGKRLITPGIDYPLGKEPIVIDSSGQPIKQLTVKLGDKGNTLVGKTADDRIVLISLDKKKSLFDDEAGWDRQETVLELPGNDVDLMMLEKEQRNLYLVNRQGDLTVVDVSDKAAPAIRHKLNVLAPGTQITSIEFLNAEISLLIGDSTGVLAQWSMVRDEQNHVSVQKLREFKVSDAAIVAISPEQRRKGMLVTDANGMIAIYNTTSERELIKEQVATGQPQTLTISPRANHLLLQAANGEIHHWQVNNEHPEVSISSLWRKVWYESYSHPQYTWQSTSASNDFEPKMSLTPLVFGTLKAAFYSMAMAIPLALFGAIYTGYFMAPSMRQYVKPGIEIMGALPSVILGFLAGLWLAPFVESHLTGIFVMLPIIPVGVMLFAYTWQALLPAAVRHKLSDGWDAFLLIPVVIFSAWLAYQISPTIESVFFNGDLRTWLRDVWGIGYDQRNTMVVGLAMGFAVIPMVFSIAEDAIFSVPRHLTTGSLALGATPWQTMVRVVLLTASPGIFSAVMIGFGRAVGETMIVLMATGNTPVMDLSIFQGLRTLSANIAVEMPESEVNSTHYRVLFLAALVLFMFTFVVNTLAEIIRQNLRQKYSSL